MALQTVTLGDAITLSVSMRTGGAAFTPAAGYQLIFTAKLATSDADVAAVLQKKSGGFGITESGSSAIIELLPIDTSALSGDITLYCDIQAQSLTDASVIKTVALFQLLTVRDVTRDTDTSIPVYTSEPPGIAYIKAEAQSGSFTAVANFQYTMLATGTVTDPATAAEGDRFSVYVSAGTGTVGGIAFPPGSIITRSYESGAWSSAVGGVTMSTTPPVGPKETNLWYDPETSVLSIWNGFYWLDTGADAESSIPEGTEVLSTGETGGLKFLRENGDGTCSWQTLTGGGDALVANPLSQFAATTSAQLAGVLSDETGTGSAVFASSPTLTTPALGTPSALVATNATGTASGLTVGATTGVEAGADVTDTANVTAAGALMDSEVTNLADVKAFDPTDYDPAGTDNSDNNATNSSSATAAQGTLADSATQPGDLGTAAALDVGTTASKVVQLNGSAELPAVSGANLTNLPSGATELSGLSDVNTSTPTNRNVLVADGVDFESRPLVEADISNLGTYSSATGVEDNADVTDTSNVTSAGALMDSEVTNLAQVKAFDTTDYEPAKGGDDNFVTDAEKTVIGNTSGTNTGDVAQLGQIVATVGGVGTAVTTGFKGFIRVPYNCSITAAIVDADQTGSIVWDVWLDTVSTNPITDVTVADTITASAKPTLSSATYAADATLTGWTTTATAGQYLGFNIDSAATLTRSTLTLTIART